MAWGQGDIGLNKGWVNLVEGSQGSCLEVWSDLFHPHLRSGLPTHLRSPHLRLVWLNTQFLSWGSVLPTAQGPGPSWDWPAPLLLSLSPGPTQLSPALSSPYSPPP